MGLPWWFSDWDSMLLMQGARVQSLVRELDPTCRNSRVNMPQIKIPHVQLTPGETK